MKSEEEQIKAVIRSYKVCYKSIEIRLNEQLKKQSKFDENLKEILTNKLQYYNEKISLLELHLQAYKQQSEST